MSSSINFPWYILPKAPLPNILLPFKINLSYNRISSDFNFGWEFAFYGL